MITCKQNRALEKCNNKRTTKIHTVHGNRICSLRCSLFVSIEMRHAPFFGWIKDLSAPDPTSIFNFFGLIPWDPPSFLNIGIWPILMGLTMYLQQKINPPPPDPIQAKIFLMLPFVFTFLLATFPSGMVVYWTVNNILSIAQQSFLLNKQKKSKL